MHRKLTEHGRCCMQNFQLQTRSHVELKDNSNVVIQFHNASMCHEALPEFDDCLDLQRLQLRGFQRSRAMFTATVYWYWR